MITAFKYVDRAVAIVVRSILLLTMAVIVVLTAWAIVSREFGFPVISGWDEIIEMMFAWMVFIGALGFVRERGLFKVSGLDDMSKGIFRRAVLVFIQLLMLVFAVVLAVWGWDFATNTNAVTPVLLIPKLYFYLCMPLAGAGMVAYGVIYLAEAAFATLPEQAESAESSLF